MNKRGKRVRGPLGGFSCAPRGVPSGSRDSERRRARTKTLCWSHVGPSKYLDLVVLSSPRSFGVAGPKQLPIHLKGLEELKEL